MRPALTSWNYSPFEILEKIMEQRDLDKWQKFLSELVRIEFTYSEVESIVEYMKLNKAEIIARLKYL